MVQSRCATCVVPGTRLGGDVGDASGTIYAEKGEFYLTEVDLSIPDARPTFPDFSATRIYQSGSNTDGVLGHNWRQQYVDEKLEFQIDGSIVHNNGLDREDRYLLNETGDGFISPPEFFTDLTELSDGSFELRFENGTVRSFDEAGNLREIRDRNDNFMSFLYNAEGQMVTVVDPLGRSINYDYIQTGVNAGRLDSITDFFDRTIDFTYNNQGDLVEVRSPIVEGTPNGNDFLEGKITRYTYSSGFSNEALNHNLLTVTRPNEVANGGSPVLINEYGTSRFEFDKIISQTYGGTNASGVEAGGTFTYEYEKLATGEFSDDPDEFVRANQRISLIRETDRNGNVEEYVFNPLGYAVEKREFTKGLRDDEPEFFETKFIYNSDGLLVEQINPEGNTVRHIYDGISDSRFAQGNLLTSTEMPDDDRGGDQTEIKTLNLYEPIYQNVSMTIDPRGIDLDFDAPITDPSSRSQLERYSTRLFFDYQEGDAIRAAQVLEELALELGITEAEVEALLEESGIELGLGDLNLDGEISTSIAGNVIVIAEPSVVLLPDSNQAIIEGDQLQDIVTLRRFNQFGQMTSMVDPEGNVHTYEFFSEQDPDGDGVNTAPPADGRTLDPDDGGYLKQQIRDAEHFEGANNGKPNVEPTAISTSFKYESCWQHH